VIDVEPLLVAGLDRLVQPIDDERADWEDVVARAGLHPRRPAPRRVAVVLAAAALAIVIAVTTPVGAAVVSSLGDFSDWIRGHPGKPAPAADQARFRGANGHSWASFPPSTELRQLIDTKVEGERYVLFGFRSGQLVCLRLRAVSLGHTTDAECAPLTTLTHLSSPIVPVVSNGSFWDEHAAPTLAFSFGVAADGVRRVDVQALDGTHAAVVGGNAYLWVQRQPNTGQHALTVSAADARGRRTTVALPLRDVLALPAVPRQPGRGPVRIQRRIEQPTVSWFVRHERRGLSPGKARLTAQQRRLVPHDAFVRLVKPDPQSNIVVGLAQRSAGSTWCLFVVQSGSGCGPAADVFRRGPINVLYFGAGYGDYIAVAGVAADGVRRIRVVLADGETQDASLRDNLFTALLPNRSPLRVVAYDAHGRVVGVDTYAGFLFGRPAPAAARRLRTFTRVRAPHGALAIVQAGRIVDGTRCRQISFVPGTSSLRCQPQIGGSPALEDVAVQPSGDDLFVYGDVGGTRASLTRRVVLLFADGGMASVVPRGDAFVIPIPEKYLQGERQRARLVLYGRHGRLPSGQAVYFRASG
jgi:hypothetical protein